MEFGVLHLSDFHFKETKIAQDVVLESMLKFLANQNEAIRPSILIITGDIAFSGKRLEYERAEKFINNLKEIIHLSDDKVFIVPGNHDVDRSKIGVGHIKWWYKFEDEEEIITNLSSEDSFPKIINKTEEFYNFLNNWKNTKTVKGKFGEFVSEIELNNGQLPKIKIVGINSTLFCGYDGDEKQQLALGLEQMGFIESNVNDRCEIIISCIHHPPHHFHPCDITAHNILERISDIILNGHVHEQINEARTGGYTGNTVLINSGAAFEHRNYFNGFSYLVLNLDNFEGKVFFYKYLPKQNIWIQNKDVNHNTNGIYKFALSKDFTLNNKVQNQAAISINHIAEKYVATISIPFDELNRKIFNELFKQLRDISGDLNLNITRIEEGSVKIYFVSSKKLSDKFIQNNIKLNDSEFINIKEVKDESLNDYYTSTDKSVYHWKTFIHPSFLENIDNPGATFTHSRIEKLTLKDLYVSPNLKQIRIDEAPKDQADKIINANEIFPKKIREGIKIVIYGDDYSGKSTLIKWWYDKYYSDGYIPILISGLRINDIKINKLNNLIENEFKKQYLNILVGTLNDYEADRIILMIDDFHKVRFVHNRYKANLISNLSNVYKNILLTGNDLMQYESYISKNGLKHNIFEQFEKYLILEFGPKLRFSLINKWNSIGVDDFEPNQLVHINKESEEKIDSIIGKNFVPAYPIYLLTILQAQEANLPRNPEYSLHGFYYELLINEALTKGVKNKDDISLYYNFITEYSFYLFDEKIRLKPVHYNEFRKFYLTYCHDYKVDIEDQLIIDTLIRSKLLKKDADYISISYKYVYYYFVARYLSNNISKKIIKNKIKQLCQRVHRDEFSNIVMFLTHLSKDQFVIEELLSNSRNLFSTYKVIQLSEDVIFINEMIKNLPEHVYLPVDINDAKEEELKEQEELLKQEREFDRNKETFNYDLEEDISALDVVARITRAVKTIEILGQLTKKYWGELKAPQKFELVEETYMLGLRTLGFYFSLIEGNTERLIDYLKHIYQKRNPNRVKSRDEIDKTSRKFLFGLCTMASYGMIKRITNSIGYEKLMGTFNDLLATHHYTSVKLIDASIKLEYNDKFPWDEIKSLKEETEHHFLSNIILKNLALNYLYMFYTSVEDRQKLCKLLNIKIEEGNALNAISTIKK